MPLSLMYADLVSRGGFGDRGGRGGFRGGLVRRRLL